MAATERVEGTSPKKKREKKKRERREEKGSRGGFLKEEKGAEF